MSEQVKKLVPILRFPEFHNSNKWLSTKVGDLIVQHFEKSDINKQYPVLTSSREGIFFQRDYYNNRDVASEDTTGYNVVPRGFFTYRHMSDDLVFKFNINNICDRGIVSTLYPVFYTKTDLVISYFFQVVLNEGAEFKEFAISQKQGGSRTYMYLNKLKELVIQIPSLDEQKKIADCLSSLDDLITAQNQKVESLKQHKKGLMQQLFPAEGETVPKLRFSEFENDGEWSNAELSNLALFVNEKISINQLTTNNYVSTENILPDYAGLVPASKLPSVGNVTRFKVSDILISNIRPYLKKVSQAEIDGGSSNDVIVVRASTKVNPIYLSYILRNDSFIEYVMEGAKGVKMPRGDIPMIKEYPVPYPKPKEQQKIADLLSSIDELITTQSQQLEAYKAHKKGLMQQLFPSLDEVNA